MSQEATHNHALPTRTYYVVFVILLVFTATTVYVSYLPLGFMHVPMALLIATIKAILVLLFFMHVLYSSRLIWVVAFSGLAWVAILLVLTMSDYMTREMLGMPGR